jgi:hypothetical protein
MKLKIILVLLISTLCNAQITLNDLKTILKMDYDSFETFAMNKGYTYESVRKEMENEKKFYGVFYKKGSNWDTKYIGLYTDYIHLGKKHVFFQTSKENDYLLIKEQLKKQGFKLIYTDEVEGTFLKEYHNSIYVLFLETKKDNLNRRYYIIALEFIK